MRTLVECSHYLYDPRRNETTLKVPFASMGSGSPTPKVDPSTILTVQWQLNARSGGPGCSADFTVENVAFY
jgi:hypothetical protein